MKQSGRLLLRALDVIERIGNRLPDPLTLFVVMAFLVVLVSWLASLAGVSAVHPGTGKTVDVVNLLSSEGVRRMLTEMVKNFAAFPPLGLVLVTMIGIGVAERSGLIAAALRALVTAVPPSALTATLVFGGVMSSMAADAGYVVLTPLGAMLFAGLGRHPLAGLAAAFAGVSGGFSANLMLTSLDPLLSGLSTPAAQLVDPSYVVHPTANYYFMTASVFLVTGVGTFVNNRFVEPRLGPWTPPEGFPAPTLEKLGAPEKRGLRAAAIVAVLALLAVAALAVPQNAVLRDAHGLKPFYESLVPLLMLFFLSCGLAYGIAAGSVRSDKDVARMTGDTIATMGGYIVLAFTAAQFVAYFSWSNLGLIMAVKGAGGLQAAGLTGLPLLVSFIFLSSGMNLLIGSASAKWAIMAPVFVPMLMLMGYSPELTQCAYRIGDSVTNIITPLLPYFPVIVAFARKYDPRTGIGTLISVMLPYSLAFGLAWTVLFSLWFAFGLPLGPGAALLYRP